METWYCALDDVMDSIRPKLQGQKTSPFADDVMKTSYHLTEALWSFHQMLGFHKCVHSRTRSPFASCSDAFSCRFRYSDVRPSNCLLTDGRVGIGALNLI
jgi:hypothetical protein